MRRTIFALLIVVLGCSSRNLDRKTATDVLNSEFSKRTERIPVRIGRVGSHCETRTDDGVTRDIDMNPASDRGAIVAMAGGYVEAVPDGESYWKIALTEKGQAFVKANQVTPEDPKNPNRCGYKLYFLPLATAQVSGITGIIPDEKMPQVEFDWNWSLTELGATLRSDGKAYKALNEVQRIGLHDWLVANPDPVLPIPAPSETDLKTPHHETVQFVKYDDGWRIK